MQKALYVLVASLLAAAATANPTPDAATLTATVTNLDARLFDAYNRCDMATFEAFFDPKVEFYHDQGGATFDSKTVVDNTRKNICHKVSRELLKETFKVYPVKDFGAIEAGEHRFCQIATGSCEGIAKFLMVWQQDHGSWHLTRIMSYGHREMTAAEKKRYSTPAQP